MLRISSTVFLTAVLLLSASPIASMPAWAQDTPTLSLDSGDSESSMEMSLGGDESDETATDDASTGDAASTDVGFNISIPTITAVGSTMDEDALRALFTGGFQAHAGELATLDATSITVPTVTFTVKESGSTTTITLSDLSLENVQHGVAAKVSLGSTDIEGAEGVSVKLNALSGEGVDFGTILGFYGITAPLSGTDFRSMYNSINFAGGSFAFPMGSCEIGAMNYGGAEARPLKKPLPEYMALMAQYQEQSKDGSMPSPEAVQGMAGYFADILSAQRGTGGTFDGLNCTGTTETGEPVKVSLGKVESGAMTEGHYPAFTLHDLMVDAGAQGVINLGSFVFKPIDFTPTIAAIEAAGTNLTAEWLSTNYRSLIPAWDGFSFTGLAVKGSNPEAGGQLVDAKVGDFDLTLGSYVNGIPTQIASSANGVAYAIPTNTTDKQLAMLVALGVTNLDLSYNLKAGWDSASQTVKLEDLSVKGKDIASVAVAATIGNAAEQLFATDPNVEQAAAMGLTLKDLNIHLTDDGVGNIVVPMIAGQSGMDPSQFRAAMAGQAEGAVLQIFGATDLSHALATAISKFTSGEANALNINVVANDPVGIAVPLLMQGSQDPTVLINQVTVTGTN